MGDIIQEIKVGLESAPSFHQISEGRVETETPSQSQSAREIDQMEIFYSDTKYWVQTAESKQL